MRAVCENRASIDCWSGGAAARVSATAVRRPSAWSWERSPLSVLRHAVFALFCTFLRKKVRLFGIFLLHLCNSEDRLWDRLELFGYSCCTVTELSVGFLIETRRQLSSEL